MCSDLKAVSQACALFSATGIVFMSWIGILLMKQPLYILGVEDLEQAKSSAFGAAGTFFFTFIVSIVYLIRDSKQDRFVNFSTRGRAGNGYGQVPISEMDLDEPDEFVGTLS